MMTIAMICVYSFHKRMKVINKGSIADINKTLIEYLLIQCDKRINY